MALNILIVDDSETMRRMIRRSVDLCGIDVGDVTEAEHGAAALEVLDQTWVDLALVDINMPVMNGEEMLERVRQQPDTRDLRVLVISTEGSETRIARLKGMGARFLHKPFTPEQLREEITALTGVEGEKK